MDASHRICLGLPASREDLLIARMALSGLGMLAGLDADLIGDLHTVTNECCDCLLSRATLPTRILLEAEVRDGRLYFCFSCEGETGNSEECQIDMDVVRGVLETLMPQVALQTDRYGICGIQCSLPLPC